MNQGSKKILLDGLSEEWFLKNISDKEGRFYSVFKRITDLFFGYAGIILLLFLYPFFGVLIKLESKGNVFYTQQRVGKNGKIFMLYKFRTMYEQSAQESEKWREKNKNCITKIGRILRWTHLDEIPQAINLLAGEVSFIGPRPEWLDLARIFEKEIPYYKKRYMVKPGLIGWAQINYPPSKSVAEAREKFEYDLYYIKNRSLRLDLEIILKSIKLYLFNS